MHPIFGSGGPVTDDYTMGAMDVLDAIYSLMLYYNVANLDVFVVIKEVREAVEKGRLEELIEDMKKAGFK